MDIPERIIAIIRRLEGTHFGVPPYPPAEDWEPLREWLLQAVKQKGTMADFDRFWENVPHGHKIAKQASRRVWARLMREGFDPEEIIAGTDNYYAAEMEREHKNPDGFTPLHPRTWLHQHRWEDEAVCPKRSRGEVAPDCGVPEYEPMTQEDREAARVQLNLTKEQLRT